MGSTFMGKVNEIIMLIEGDPAFRLGNVLDIRPHGAFLEAHLAGAASHPLPDGDWSEVVPSIILPPRHEPLLVLGESRQPVAALAEHLQARGRCAVSSLELDAEVWGHLPADLVRQGDERHHLWAPPPWLTRHADLLPPPALGPVLDLGCGSGRAAVYLAERGYRVTGLDRQGEALEMGRDLARQRGTACEFRQVDLRDPAVVPPGPYALVGNFRFLQRELLEQFHRWLLPGGVALVRTFRDAPGYEGHPHLRHRLGRGELLRFFPRGKFQILAHEEGFDPDGRPAAGVVARLLF
jgi:tellurite methyltransferase